MSREDMQYASLYWVDDDELIGTVRFVDTLTIQHMDYTLSHPQSGCGRLFGSTQPVLFNLAVRLVSETTGKAFYDRMACQGSHAYILLFNARYKDGYLSDYEFAIKLYGFVVDIEENFDYEAEEVSQVIVKVQVLANAITYLGRNNNYTINLYQETN